MDSTSNAPLAPTHLMFEDFGVAYAHLTLPVGRYAAEADALQVAIAAMKPSPLLSRISFLTGQSDVMLELHIRDFRSTAHLQYTSEAMGANWLFLVPYRSRGKTTSATDPLNCVVHVRFVRDAYRRHGAEFERRVVVELQRLANDHRLHCEVMAGFGWSDIAVGGSFARIDDLRRFVRAVENYDEGRAVQRVLTLVGYDRNTRVEEADDEQILPILFARVLPTHIHQAVNALYESLPSPDNWIGHSIDGKWDLVYTVRDRLSLREYLDMHRTTVASSNLLRDAGIERFESHLVADRVHSDAPAERPLTECGCRRAFDAIPPMIDPSDSDAGLLPRALWRAILNVNDLFRAASRDTTNCCDAVPSLMRCAAAGRRLVMRYKRLTEEIESLRRTQQPSGELTAWLAVLARAREDIEDWCTYSERSVSQRTVGRFEEFLAQNERVVSYRGGIQKMLYIADALTNAYAKKILTSANDRTFVTLYDPVDTVVNMRTTGFIRVPVRYLFFLPLAITHLWHEVGVHVFFCNYSIPFDARAKRRAAAFAANSPARTPQGRSREIARMYVEIAEMYGDFITLHYGFREDVDAFMLALASAMLEQVGFQSATIAGKETYFVYLLTRLYLVIEFKTRRELVAEAMRDHPLTCDRDRIDGWKPGEEFIQRTVQKIGEFLNRELLLHARYIDEPAASIALREAAKDNFSRLGELVTNAANDFDIAHRTFMNDLVWQLPPVVECSPQDRDAFESIRRGEVIAFGPAIDPNAVYQHLQREMIETIRHIKRNSSNEETFLQATAALMRSALLAFYAQERDEAAETRRSWKGMLDDVTVGAAHLPDLDFSLSNVRMHEEGPPR